MAEINLDEFVARRATLADYDGIMAISEGVFDGMDYLTQQFHELYQHPNSNFFVGVYKGKVVCMVHSTSCFVLFVYFAYLYLCLLYRF